MELHKPVLGYWKTRGRANGIRTMLNFCAVDFEDYMYEVGAAPIHSKDSWFTVKQSIGLDFPNLPYLIDGDLKLTESLAIYKYVARKYRPELLGATAQEFAFAEMLSEFVG